MGLSWTDWLVIVNFLLFTHILQSHQGFLKIFLILCKGIHFLPIKFNGGRFFHSGTLMEYQSTGVSINNCLM